jgi:hypothetical protein
MIYMETYIIFCEQIIKCLLGENSLRQKLKLRM